MMRMMDQVMLMMNMVMMMMINTMSMIILERLRSLPADDDDGDDQYDDH